MPRSTNSTTHSATPDQPTTAPAAGGDTAASGGDTADTAAGAHSGRAGRRAGLLRSLSRSLSGDPREVLRALVRITEALASEIEPGKAYEAILTAVREATGARAVSLQLLRQPDPVPSPPTSPQLFAPASTPVALVASLLQPPASTLVLVEKLGLSADVKIGDTSPLDNSIAGWVLRHRQPLLLNGASHPDPEVQRLMRRAPGLSAICVPLIAKGEPIGVLNASKIGVERPFDESDLDFLAILAGQAAITLNHARLYDRLSQQATIDSLTGLLNHAAFQTRLAAELERASRVHQSLGLLQIDLDGFKLVNDTYGHPTGDRLLQLLARDAIRSSIRHYDIACRPGGDEFAVILPHATAEQSILVAERIRNAVATCDTTVAGVPLGMVAASIGVAHFPTDGVRREDLVETADNALYLAKYLGRNRVERGSSAVANFERDPESLHDLLMLANASTVEALAAAIDARDAFTAGHSRRVAEYALQLAHALGKDDHYCHDLRLACLFHDVGKIAVPDAVLRKAGKLDDDEFALMRDHPQKGAELLDHVPFLTGVVDAIRSHHERWDGRGYPDGLHDETIPEMARIIAIADAYDAMTSDRVYRGALLTEDVIRIFQGGAGIQWDPAFVATWVSVLQSRPSSRTPSSSNSRLLASPLPTGEGVMNQ